MQIEQPAAIPENIKDCSIPQPVHQRFNTTFEHILDLINNDPQEDVCSNTSNLYFLRLKFEKCYLTHLNG